MEQHLVGRRALAALLGELHVELDRAEPGWSARWASTMQADAGRGVELDDELVRLRVGVARPKPSLGGCLNTSRSSVWVTGRRLPVRMKNGTPAQRQFSISSRSAA